MNYDLISSSSSEMSAITVNQNSKRNPVKVVRRVKKTFPTKRYNYKNYQYAEWKWYDILIEIDLLKKESSSRFFKLISVKYNICRRTLIDKYSKWIKDGRPITINNENRGNETYFSIDEERNLFEYINDLYIKNDLFFDDLCLKILALKTWKELHLNDSDKFKASKGWVYEFKIRWGLSSFIARN